MGVLPTVGVQQVVEQLPVLAQQAAVPAGPGALPPPPAPEGIRDVVEISRTVRLEPVGEFSATDSREKSPDVQDPRSPSRKNPDRRKNRRRSLDTRA
ncbi:hypothetical protein [Leptospirillum ferriphilum]|uniref:Uncharacterized protein n=2 Tax=Leptospirillum ferriphilum TaxID=178606 RepID=A0A1V3SS50_9BACT|nr:hypothetical protein [Leptospirillum ferriphilum]AFS52501.1 hypothetical protein LFML04_0256 [Leptospirillum ferriphilum ML-04]OOH69709.1 hypothetical protein BOX24_11845 [Leptospirillum ferriphilum]